MCSRRDANPVPAYRNPRFPGEEREPTHVGATFKRPPPQRSMWADEHEHPWLRWAAAAAILVTLLVSGAISHRWSFW